jgi:hypothetical protein
VFPKKEGGEEGEDKEKEREEKEGGGEEEYARIRTMVSQDDVNLKAIDHNEDNSNRSNNNDQSNHGNYNSSSQKQQQQQSKDTGGEASWMHANKYWNWLPNSATPAKNKGMTVLEMKEVSLLSLQPTMMHITGRVPRSCLSWQVVVVAGLSRTTRVGHPATLSLTVMLTSPSP